MNSIKQFVSLSQEEFDTELKYEPFLLVNGASNWPAIKKWTTSNIYRKLPPGKHSVTVFDNSKIPGKLFINLTPKEITERINLLDSEYKYYFAPAVSQETFPKLFKDIIYPTLISSKYIQEINLWFGQRSNKTILHFDLFDNFLVQVYGRKKVKLFSPDNTPYLYPTITTSYKEARLSRIIDVDNPDLEVFPEFINAEYCKVIISPGDMLYIPAKWWHEVQSLDVSLSINFFYEPNSL